MILLPEIWGFVFVGGGGNNNFIIIKRKDSREDRDGWELTMKCLGSKAFFCLCRRIVLINNFRFFLWVF